MRKQFQSSWHDINFKDFIEVTDKKVAGLSFYESFYKQFFSKYRSYSDIPVEYVENKLVVVRYLESKLRFIPSVISIGCGIGLIEYLLSQQENLDAKIIAVEPSEAAITWIKFDPNIEVHNGFFPDILRMSESVSFEYGYARAIEYVFDRDEYVEFLKSVVDFGIKEFSIISVCIQRRNLLSILKESIKTLLSKISLYDRGQFWGYLRTKQDHEIAFKEAGFRDIKFQQLDYSTLVITGKC